MKKSFGRKEQEEERTMQICWREIFLLECLFVTLGFNARTTCAEEGTMMIPD
jgi:hypothetical protein